MNKTDKYFKAFWVLAMLLMLTSMVIHYKQQGIILGDHEWLWKECACTLKGVDSAIAIQQNMLFPDIGELPPSTATAPWTKTMGVLVHGAFLPYEASCVFYAILNFGAFFWMLYLVFQNMYKRTQSYEIAGMSILAIFSSWYFVDWIQMGNNGSIVCFLTICAICLQDDHEILAGICAAVAMIKPQIVLPFFITWLFLRKWKLIITSVSIVLVSWWGSVYITKVSPFVQLKNLLNMRVDMTEEYLVYGIFDQLRAYGVDTELVMLLSMLAGTAVTIYLTLRYLASDKKNKLFWSIYVIPAMVSVFWSYKSQCDYNILPIISIAIVEYWYQSNKTWKQLCICVALAIVCMMKPFSVLGITLDRLGIWGRLDNVYMMNRFDLYVKSLFVIVGVLLYTSKNNLNKIESQ